MENHIRCEAIILESRGEYDKVIKILREYIEKLYQETDRDVKEDLGWSLYWLARVTYISHSNDLVNNFKSLEQTILNSIEYTGITQGVYKAESRYLLATLYNNVCPEREYNSIKKLYLDSANYYHKLYENLNDYDSLKTYADIYNNLAKLTKETIYIDQCLKCYKILLKNHTNKEFINEKVQDVYKTSYEVYNYDGNEFKANYYLNKIEVIKK